MVNHPRNCLIGMSKLSLEAIPVEDLFRTGSERLYRICLSSPIVVPFARYQYHVSGPEDGEC